MGEVSIVVGPDISCQDGTNVAGPWEAPIAVALEAANRPQIGQSMNALKEYVGGKDKDLHVIQQVWAQCGRTSSESLGVRPSVLGDV